MSNFQLLRVIRLYCERTGTPETVFGRQVANDPRLIGDMRNGRTLREKMVRRVCDHMGIPA